MWHKIVDYLLVHRHRQWVLVCILISDTFCRNVHSYIYIYSLDILSKQVIISQRIWYSISGTCDFDYTYWQVFVIKNAFQSRWTVRMLQNIFVVFTLHLLQQLESRIESKYIRVLIRLTVIKGLSSIRFFKSI